MNEKLRSIGQALQTIGAQLAALGTDNEEPSNPNQFYPTPPATIIGAPRAAPPPQSKTEPWAPEPETILEPGASMERDMLRAWLQNALGWIESVPAVNRDPTTIALYQLASTLIDRLDHGAPCGEIEQIARRARLVDDVTGFPPPPPPPPETAAEQLLRQAKALQFIQQRRETVEFGARHSDDLPERVSGQMHAAAVGGWGESVSLRGALRARNS